MSHLTASEDIDLFTAVLDKACADASATAAFEADFLEALDAMDITCLSKFCAYKYGVFLVVPGGVGPLHEFRDELIAASAGKLTDDAMLGRTLFLLKDGCTQFWAEAKAKHRLPAGPPPAVVVAPAVMTDEEKERKDCATAYSDLETVQGRAVDLPMRATFVAQARNSIKNYGYIQEVPKLDAVRTYGTSGSRRHRVTIGDGAMLSFGEKQAELIGGLPEAHRMTRIMMNGIAAAGSLSISDTAYNSREIGWINVPGKADQVRVMLPLEAADKLTWALIAIATPDAATYRQTAIACIEVFLTEWARMRLHPSEIVDDLTSARPHLFIPRGPETDASTEDLTTEVGSSVSARGGTPVKGGVCESWLQGGCRKEAEGTCVYAHPERLRGAGQGTGAGNRRRSGGGGGGGGNWGGGGWGSPPWAWQAPQASQSQSWGDDWSGYKRQRGSRGKGKGKGGGKGKGWGKGW